MPLSAVSVLVVAQPSSEFPEEIINYPIFERNCTLYVFAMRICILTCLCRYQGGYWDWKIKYYNIFLKLNWFKLQLAINPLTWKIRWAPNNARKCQMGFNLAFKGLNIFDLIALFRSSWNTSRCVPRKLRVAFQRCQVDSRYVPSPLRNKQRLVRLYWLTVHWGRNSFNYRQESTCNAQTSINRRR